MTIHGAGDQAPAGSPAPSGSGFQGHRPLLLPLLVVLVTLVAWAPASADGVDRFRPFQGPTPALELKDLAGNTHTLAQHKGHVVLVNFWATWCPPCRDEMPSLQALRHRLAGQPFVILGVNYGEGPNRISSFLRQVPVDFPILRDPRHEAIEAWRVRTLPATFLVGSDSQVRYSVVGELDWASDDVVARIRKLLP